MLVAQSVSKKQAASNRIDCHRSKRMVCNLQGEVNQDGTQVDKGNDAKNTRYTHLTQATLVAPRISRGRRGGYGVGQDIVRPQYHTTDKLSFVILDNRRRVFENVGGGIKGAEIDVFVNSGGIKIGTKNVDLTI